MKNLKGRLLWVKLVDDSDEIKASLTIIRQAVDVTMMLSTLPFKQSVRDALIDPSKSYCSQRFTALRIRKLLTGITCKICHSLDKDALHLMKKATSFH